MPSCETLFASESLRFLVQALTVGVGWYVVHRLSSSRDQEKARRELVVKSSDSLASLASNLLDDARSYHIQNRDKALELKIKSTLSDLSLSAAGLATICGDAGRLAACRTSVIKLRQAITSAHFEDEHEGPLAEGDQLLEQIAADVLGVKRNLMNLKHNQYAVGSL